MTKGIVAVVLLIAVGASWRLAVGGGREASAPAPPVHRRPSVASRQLLVKATGVIKPMTGAEVRVGSRLSGVVRRLHVKIGDRVPHAVPRTRLLRHPAPDGGSYVFRWMFRREMITVHNLLIALLLAIMIGVIITAHLVLRRLLRPLRTLGDGVARLSDGQLDVVLPNPTRDEFGALTGSSASTAPARRPPPATVSASRSASASSRRTAGRSPRRTTSIEARSSPSRCRSERRTRRHTRSRGYTFTFTSRA